MVFVWLSRRLGADTWFFFEAGTNTLNLVCGATVSSARCFAARTRARLRSPFSANLSGSGSFRSASTPRKPIHIETTVASDEGSERARCRERSLRRPFESFRVLFLSRVLREKGVYIAIDAFAACRRVLRGRRMSLHIAGSGPELAFAREYVAAKNLPDVVFEGEVSGLAKQNC